MTFTHFVPIHSFCVRVKRQTLAVNYIPLHSNDPKSTLKEKKKKVNEAKCRKWENITLLRRYSHVKHFFGHQKPLKVFGRCNVQSVKRTNSQVQGNKSRGIQCRAWDSLLLHRFDFVQHTCFHSFPIPSPSWVESSVAHEKCMQKVKPDWDWIPLIERIKGFFFSLMLHRSKQINITQHKRWLNPKLPQHYIQNIKATLEW